MTNRRDHRYGRRSNCAGHRFFIKCPEVFDGSTTAAYDDYIDPAVYARISQGARMKLVKKLDRAHDLLGRAVALYSRRREQHVHRAGASRDNIEDVANRSAARRSDHADSP